MVERFGRGIRIAAARLTEDKAPVWFRLTEYVLAVCLIIQCRTFWMHLVIKGAWVNKGVFAVIVLALLLLITHDTDGRRALSISKDHVKNCIIVILYVAIYVFVVPVRPKAVIRCAAVLVLVMLFFYSGNSDEKVRRVLIKYKNIMVFLAAFSVACWVLLSVFHFLPYPWTGSIYINWTNDGEVGERSHFLYLYSEMQWFVVNYITRNTSIFVEGPMYCYCLSIALFIELYAEDKSRPVERHICRWALLLAELTCLTTVGFMYLAVIAATAYIKNRMEETPLAESESNEALIKSIWSALAVAAVLCLFFLIRKLSVLSGTVRIDDITAGIDAWLTKPWFGSGFENQNYIDKFISTWRVDNLGYSNSPGLILANGGLYLALIYIYAWGRILRNGLRRRTMESYVVTFLYLLMFTVTIIPYQYLTMFFMLTLATGKLQFTEATRVNFNLKAKLAERLGRGDVSDI